MSGSELRVRDVIEIQLSLRSRAAPKPYSFNPAVSFLGVLRRRAADPRYMKLWDRRMIGHFQKWHIMYLP